MCLRTPPARSDARRPGTANLRYCGRKGMLARDDHQPEATTYIPTYLPLGLEGRVPQLVPNPLRADFRGSNERIIDEGSIL